MMQERFLGGESSGRSLFGGSANKPRTIGLAVVGVGGGLLTLVFQLPGLAAALMAVGVVFAATTKTDLGSPWQRRQARRRWKERCRRGTRSFRPVARRPDGLEQRLHTGGRRTRAAALVEWNAYRDWPDGVEGMQWLAWGRGVPGIAWHAPTGEDAYLSVVFPLAGQIRGIESDAVVDGCAAAFGAMLAGYGSASARPSRVQVITRVLPVDSANHEAWVLANLDPDTPPVLLRSYDEVVKKLGRGGLMQRHFAVVRWPLDPRFVKAAGRLGPAQQGWVALMGREIDAARRHLGAARLGPGPALSAAQCGAVLRHMQLPSWPIDQAGDIDLHNPWVATDDQWPYTVAEDAGPDGAVQRWLHRSARVPIEAVQTGPRNALWLMPLLAALPHQIVRTLSVQIEPVPAAQARADAKADVTSDLANVAAQVDKGMLVNEDLQVEQRAAAARLKDLEPGSGAQGALWVMHLLISARTQDELADASEKIEEAADACGITSLDWADAQHAGAAACTWPVARGMATAGRSASARLQGVLAGPGHQEALT